MVSILSQLVANRIGRTAAIAAAVLFLVAPALVPGQHHEARESVATESGKGVQARYAEANLHLAKIELQIALTENAKIPNLYSALTVQRLRNNVDYAQEMLRHENRSGESGLHALHLTEVEGALKLAESDLAAAVAANKRVHGSFSDLEIERLRAAADVARLALEKAHDPTVTQSPMDHLQWQLDRMRSELTRLNVRMDKVESHN